MLAMVKKDAGFIWQNVQNEKDFFFLLDADGGSSLVATRNSNKTSFWAGDTEATKVTTAGGCWATSHSEDRGDDCH